MLSAQYGGHLLIDRLGDLGGHTFRSLDHSNRIPLILDRHKATRNRPKGHGREQDADAQNAHHQPAATQRPAQSGGVQALHRGVSVVEVAEDRGCEPTQCQTKSREDDHRGTRADAHENQAADGTPEAERQHAWTIHQARKEQTDQGSGQRR
ncbi:MAG: Uncharacterised protein [Synechococcus sp. MIT S9220]|nr:MAG: Uncharacterised protein [Synechococcus sp. MIT S9220]